MTRLDEIPRIALGHEPTPIEFLGRLTEHLGGAEIWIKRDDCTGLAFGGNKVRKLEYLLAEACAQGHDTVITVGGVQSNHARQTAAAAARLGLRCELVLPRLVAGRDEIYESNGNLLLDRLLGARVHLVADSRAAATRVGALLDELRRSGHSAAFFPAGGSTATGSLGYVRAMVELARQVGERGLCFDRIVLAVSTGGTLAGLVVGRALAALSTRITGIAVSGSAEEASLVAGSLIAGTAARLGIEVSDPGFEVRDGFLGEGYGLETPGMREALGTCARLEGLLLDPVYTGKAMAGLFDLVRRGELGRETSVLFWHTGGTPALFACAGSVE